MWETLIDLEDKVILEDEKNDSNFLLNEPVSQSTDRVQERSLENMNALRLIPQFDQLATGYLNRTV